MRVYNRDYEGVWDGIHWDGERASFFALRENEEGRARTKLLQGCKMNRDWNFGRSRYKPLSLDQFLAGKEAAGFKFFAGQEPWIQAIKQD